MYYDEWKNEFSAPSYEKSLHLIAANSSVNTYTHVIRECSIPTNSNVIASEHIKILSPNASLVNVLYVNLLQTFNTSHNALEALKTKRLT